MDKVYFNLLSNAFKFTPDNGKISISIVENQDNTVKIHFKDSGIGIPDDELSNVFDPFSGLQITIRIVQELGFISQKSLCFCIRERLN